MTNDTIVLLTHPYDQGDILKEYIEWYLGLGVDLIIAHDLGSSDNTHEILNGFSNKGQLQWALLPERNMLKYRSPDTLAKMSIQHGGDWIIMSDGVQFLCPQGDHLRTILRRPSADIVNSV